MPLVIQSLCEDLLMGAYAGGSMMACVDDGVMASLMAEVDEPALQRKVLQLAVAAASADRHLADGEAVVIAAVRRYWGLGEEAGTESRIAADTQAA